MLLAALVAFAIIATRPEPGAQPNPEPPVAKPINIKKDIRILFTDMENAARRPEVEWYRAALSDMLITQLAQTPYLKLPTRDEMLWKLREKDPAIAAVSDDYKQILVKEFSPLLYFTGSYVVQGGTIRVSMKGYKYSDGSFKQVFVRQFEHGEHEVFKLIDDMAAALLDAMRKDPDTLLTFGEDGRVLRSTEELFAANYLPASTRVPGPQPVVEKANAVPRRVLDRSEEPKWVYGLKFLCEQAQTDRQACESLKHSIISGDQSQETLQNLNEALKKMNKPYQVRLACRKCGTQSSCPGCPGYATLLVTPLEKEK
jgi:TolB-like protein